MKINRAIAWLAVAVALVAAALLSACGGSSNPVNSVNLVNSTNYSFSSAAPKFAIVGNDACSPTVSVFSVNATTGALTEVTNSPFTVNAVCPRVSVHPNGKWVYITDNSGGAVEAYSIDGSGNLTLLSVVSDSGAANSSVFSSDGKYLFTADGDAFVSAFQIDGATGVLTNLGATNAWTAGSSFVPLLYTIAIAGNYLYAGNQAPVFPVPAAQPYVYGFTVNASGNPVSISGSPWITPGVMAGFLAADWNGSFLYAGTVNIGGTIQDIYGYKVNSNGSLTALTGPPLFGGSQCDFWQMVFEPRNKFVYVVDANAGAWAYSFDSTTGTLAKVTGSPFAAGTNPQTLAADPSGKFLYVANESSNDISGYTINQNTGALTSMGSTFTFSSMTNPYTIAFTH